MEQNLDYKTYNKNSTPLMWDPDIPQLQKKKIPSTRFEVSWFIKQKRTSPQQIKSKPQQTNQTPWFLSGSHSTLLMSPIIYSPHHTMETPTEETLRWQRHRHLYTQLGRDSQCGPDALVTRCSTSIQKWSNGQQLLRKEEGWRHRVRT